MISFHKIFKHLRFLIGTPCLLRVQQFYFSTVLLIVCWQWFTLMQNQECVQQLRQLLVELCREHGTDQSNALVNNLLANDAQPVGLLVNERFINIPAQICVPLFESLRLVLMYTELCICRWSVSLCGYKKPKGVSMYPRNQLKTCNNFYWQKN